MTQGAILGEIVAGTGSDLWMLWRTKRANGNREPEFRLPFAIPGVLVAVREVLPRRRVSRSQLTSASSLPQAVGIIIFGVQLQNTQAGHWVSAAGISAPRLPHQFVDSVSPLGQNVTPVIGVAIALFGTQLVTTVIYAYTVESQPAELQPRVPGFIAFARQLYAFTAPFYLEIPYENWGALTSHHGHSTGTLSLTLELNLLCRRGESQWNVGGRGWGRRVDRAYIFPLSRMTSALTIRAPVSASLPALRSAGSGVQRGSKSWSARCLWLEHLDVTHAFITCYTIEGLCCGYFCCVVVAELETVPSHMRARLVCASSRRSVYGFVASD